MIWERGGFSLPTPACFFFFFGCHRFYDLCTNRVAWNRLDLFQLRVVKRVNIFSGILACVASVSVRFRSKERPRKGIFGFDRARNETRAKKWKRGEGKGPFVARSLTLVPRSLLLNRTETLATQATGIREIVCLIKTLLKVTLSLVMVRFGFWRQEMKNTYRSCLTATSRDKLTMCKKSWWHQSRNKRV